MLNKIIILILLTFMPFAELRLSIPAGILSGSLHFPLGITLNGLGMNPFLVFVIAALSNILLGFVLFHVWHYLDAGFRKSFVKKPYIKFMEKSHKKLKPFVDKYGVLGVALFIGIPLPGSGVYSGSLGSWVLGLDRKQFYKATVIGVLVSGILVTTLVITGRLVF